jgi:hypothetical protein
MNYNIKELRRLALSATVVASFTLLGNPQAIAFTPSIIVAPNSNISPAHLCHTECVRSGAVCHSHGSAPWCFTNSCTCSSQTPTTKMWMKTHPRH